MPPTLCLILLALVGLPLLAGQPARAQSDIFTVRAVEVDATADTAANARAAAVAQGQAKAFRALTKRLVLASDWPRVAQPSRAVLSDLVQDFSVAGERTSSVRYLADLTVRFRPAAVRDYLQQLGVSFSESRSKPVLVLPLYGTAGRAVLWEEPNPWRATWAVREPDDGLVPLTVPLGDLSDVTAVSAEQAIDGDRAALGALARRYGAEDVLINQLALAGDPLVKQATLQVVASRLGAGGQERSFVFRLRQQPDQTLDDLLALAADQVSRQVQEDWKVDNQFRYGEESSLTAIVPVESLDQWLAVKQRLASVPSVLDSRLVAMTRYAVEVQITYVGDEQQLARTMAQGDLRMTTNAETGWLELRLSTLASQSGTQ